MRFSIVAATAILASTVSAGYGYEHNVTPSPSPSPSKAPVVPEYQETVKTVVTVDCGKEPAKCPYGGHKPTSTIKPVQPSGYYGNVTHPIQTPTYPVPGKDYPHGGKKPEGGDKDKEYEHGGKKPEGGDDDKYQLTTITTTVCVPTTYVTKVLKPTVPGYGPTGGAVKPTGAPVVKPTPSGIDYKGAASSMQMGSFAVIAGVAAFILA